MAEDFAGKPGISCWNRIGVWGDSSCGELSQAVHCHNCSVFGHAGRGLLDREPPPDYLSAWTTVIATEAAVRAPQTESVLLFRIQGEWLALPTHLFRELLDARMICRVPHRTDEVFLGLVNVQGETQLCVSLSRFLRLEDQEDTSDQISHIIYPRMAVVEKSGSRWVFPLDEVHDVYRFHADEILPAPATVARSSTAFTRGILRWQGKDVGYLDDELLFAALQRRIG
jgi:chemotaxis-related protein WspD